MERALLFILLGSLLSSVVTLKTTCTTVTDRSTDSVTLRCNGLPKWTSMYRQNSRPTTIEIADSTTITNLPGSSFVGFGRRLKKLDLHGNGIQTIDNSSFATLVNLEELLLWGNRLQVVYGDYFAETPKLKTLDVSFNNIQVIDYKVFLMLPNLENLYFDYNQIKFIDYSMLADLKNLKNVKFEKNPLNWGFRAHLMWQLDNQKVRYKEEWENWEWMNTMIKKCAQSGHGEIPKDTVLDCIVGELLDFAHEIFSTEPGQQKNECTTETELALRCMRPKNVTGNTDNETIRRILESYVAAVLTPAVKPQGRFSMWFTIYS